MSRGNLDLWINAIMAQPSERPIHRSSPAQSNQTERWAKTCPVCGYYGVYFPPQHAAALISELSDELYEMIQLHGDRSKRRRDLLSRAEKFLKSRRNQWPL